MSNPIQAVHANNEANETKAATPPAKPPQAPSPSAAPQDTVTISSSAKALAGNSKSGG